MKKLVVIFALFMLFKPALPVVEYVVFYDYIKNELCVNQDKPEMHCNGKCHLAKEMAKAADNDQTDKNREHNFSVTSQIVFCQPFSQLHFAFFAKNFVAKTTWFFYNNLYFFQRTTSVFHPPMTH